MSIEKEKNFTLRDFLPYRLSILSNRISLGISEIYQEKYALSITEWRTMAILGSYPDSTASEIVQHTAIDKVAISRAVKKLLVRNFIEREIDTEDRRRQTLRLTQIGQEVYDDVFPKALNFEQKFTQLLDYQDFSDLDRIVSKLQMSSEE